MAVFQQSVQTSDRIPSFQETFQFAYSHGLEAIYTLENVDFKSVRKLSQPTVEKKPEKSIEILGELTENQLTFDLGPLYRNWMPSFTDQEPLQVLQLTKQIEKTLIDKSLRTIGDLQKVNFHDTAFLKGLGQGHIEDLRKKLAAYVEGKPRHKATSIDFLSLLKCLTADLDRRKVYVLLEPHGLVDWLSLTPLESVELKKLTAAARSEWCEEMHTTIIDKNSFLFSQLQLIIQTWIIPWMNRRGGFATSNEIFEALALHASDYALAEKSIPLIFKWIALDELLPQVKGVFATSGALKEEYKRILALISGYFVSPGTCYGLTELQSLIRQELAIKWHSFSGLERLLRLSPSFQVYRKESGEWMIKKSLGKLDIF